MAITRTATPTSSASFTTSGAKSFAHTCAANTSLLLLVIQLDAVNTITGTPTWNTSENFTLIRNTGTGTSAGDVRQIVYGLVNPTAGNFNIAFTVSGAVTAAGIAFAVSYLGTETSSVAAAAIYLDEQINNAAATTVAMNEAVGGVAGRTAFAAATFLGGDGDPASETASGGQFATPMFNSATGTSTTADRSYWVADQINWTPAAVTVDWTGAISDECVGTVIELVPAVTDATVTLDTGTVTVAGSDLLAHLNATLDTGASTVAGSDVVNLPTALAAVNTGVTLEVDTTYLVRVRVRNTGGEGGTSFRWTYSHQGGAHTPITTTSSVVKAVAASSFANNDDVPEAIGGGGTYVINNDAATEDGTTTLPVGFPAGGAIEFVLAYQIVGADVSDEDAILPRLELGDGTDFTTYTNTPTITVNKVGAATIVLDTAAIAVAGADLAANASITLDTGTIAVAGNDLAANPTITLDTDDVAVAGVDLAAAQSITLDTDDIAVAGADLVILEDRTLVLDTGSISLVGTDIVILADTTLVLDTGAVVAAGTDLVPLQQWAVLPNAVIASSNLIDTDLNSPPTKLSDITDDPVSPDGNRWSAIDSALDTEAHLGCDSPAGGALHGPQIVQLFLYKSGAANPTANIELWLAGVFEATLASGVSITNSSGQLVEVDFDGTGMNKADIEIKVVGLAA